MLEGIGELGEQIFDMPVKLGIPHGFGGLVGLARSPIHATGIGLIQYGIQFKEEDLQDEPPDETHLFEIILNWMEKNAHKYFSWIKNF